MSSPETNGRPTAPGQEGEALSLGALLRLVRRHRLMFAAILLGCMGAAAVISFLTDPLYSSDVFLRIDDDDNRAGLLADLPSLPGAGGGGEIETEILVLRSRELAERVTDSLALRVQLKEPNRPRERLVHVEAAGTSRLGALVELDATGTAGEYAVTVDTRQEIGQVPTRVRVNEAFDVGDVRLVLRSIERGMPERIVLEILPWRSAVNRFRENLQVVRPEREAKIVKIAFVANDSLLVAAVPNALARAFIRYKSVSTHSEERSTVEFLQSQVETYSAELAVAEERLREYREQNQVVSLTDQATEQIKQLAQYQTDRNALVQERDGLQRLLRQVETTASEGSTSPFRQIASFPSLFTNRAVQDMLMALNDLENQRARAAIGRTPSNAEVQSLDQRISDIEAQLHQLTRSYVSNLDTQIADTEAMLGRFTGRLDDVPAVEMQFARLARDQMLLEEIYTLLLTRLKEAEVKAAVEPGDVRVIDSAIVPTDPIAPRPFRNMLLGTLIGIVLATSSVYIRFRSNTTVQSREDVQALAGSTPVLGYIPHMQAAGGARLAGAWRLPWRRPVHMNGHGAVHALAQDAGATEAYRSLRTNLQFLARGDRTPVLLITSSIPGEGKSTTAVNLASTLAREGRRILLVDADLRRGQLHTKLSVPKAPGLAQVILGETSLSSAVNRVEASEGGTFDVVSAGGYPPNAAELLGSNAMSELLEAARLDYDTIILDAPPIAAVTDAAVMSRASDTTMVVVRSGLTPKAALEYTISQLGHVGARVGGIVINDIARDRDAGYYAYSYYDYESRT